MQTVQRRPATDGDEEQIASRFGRLRTHDDPAGGSLHGNRALADDPDPFRLQNAFHDSRGFRFLFGQHAFGEERYARTEPPVRLRDFHADRTSADDDHFVRETVVLENRAIREEGNVVETGDRGDDGLRSRCDENFAGPNPFVADRERAPVDERRRSEHDPDPFPAQGVGGLSSLLDYYSSMLYHIQSE